MEPKNLTVVRAIIIHKLLHPTARLYYVNKYRTGYSRHEELHASVETIRASMPMARPVFNGDMWEA
jgi:hypothetical protein